MSIKSTQNSVSPSSLTDQCINRFTRLDPLVLIIYKCVLEEAALIGIKNSK